MFRYLLIALLVILVISLIYYIFWYDSDRKKRKESEESLNRSAGIFDMNARRALDELTQIAHPIARDRFNRGRILHHNVLGGNIAGGNRQIINDIVRNYTDTIVDLHNDNTRDDNTEFIINTVEDFGHLLQGEDILIQAFILQDVIGNYLPAIRDGIIKERIETATATTDTRSEAANKALDDAIKYTNDNQNVHESKVNNDLRSTLMRIKESVIEIDVDKCISEAAEYINKCTNPIKLQNATRTLNKIREGNFILTFGDREDRIFAYIWDRCSHPRNSANADLMRDAIADALADSIENNQQVCANGRCGRILSSLVTLDYDSEVGHVMTYEAYRNQIFQETKKIINDEINRADNDEKSKNALANYESGEDPVTPDDIFFRENMKHQIDANIDSYANKLSQEEIATIKHECHAYAAI